VDKNEASAYAVEGRVCYFTGLCFSLKMRITFDSYDRDIADHAEAAEYLNSKYGVAAFMDGGMLCLKIEDIPKDIDGFTFEHLEWPDAMP